MGSKISPKQGEIWLFDPDPVKGREIGKKIRPALIVSCNALNDGSSGLVILVPCTSKDKGIDSHVRIDPPEGGVSLPTFVMCEQIRAVSKERLIKRVGRIENERMKDVHSWLIDFLWIEPTFL